MKRYLLNWTTSKEINGGCEVIFNNLKPGINADLVTSTGVMELLGLERNHNYYRYAIVDRAKLFRDFMALLDDIEPGRKTIISNDCCTPQGANDNLLITYAQNPYYNVAEILTEYNVYSRVNNYEFKEFYVETQARQFNASDQIVVCSNFMKEYVSRFTDKKPKLIHHGVNTDLFKPMNKEQIRKEMGIPLNKKVGIWVGAFHPLKGYNFIPALVKKYKDIHWILVFKHNLKETPQRDNITIFQNIQQPTLAKLFNCADFNLMPSLCESFNLVSCEAMACNIPIVVSNTGFFRKKEEEGVHIREEPYGIVLNNLSEKILDFSVEEILNIETKPRKYIIENKITMPDWINRWKNYLKDVEK